MSDIATICGTGVGAAFSIPCLKYFGIDPTALAFGLIGAIVAQTLLRDRSQPLHFWSTLAVMFGSMLLAGTITPAVSLFLAGDTPATQYHAFTAMLLGAGAQPIAVAGNSVLIKRAALVFNWLVDRVTGSKPNA